MNAIVRLTRFFLRGVGGRIALAFALAASAVHAESPSSAPAGCPRHVILVSIDTLRADHLGCYGYGRPTSPTIDRLAARGIRFLDASAPSSWTLPSHASLLTGLYPRRHGVRHSGSALPGGVVTLAERLTERGFATVAVVNSYFLKQRFRLNQGFGEYVNVHDNQSRTAAADRVDDRALEMLAGLGDQRLFLFVHFFDVHSHYHSQPHFEQLFVEPYDGIVDGGTKQLLQFCKKRITLGEPDLRQLKALYDGGIRQLDATLDRLFKALRMRGLLDDALIIITSDHGEEFGEHGSFLHGRTQYQEVLHVPLIMLGPGIPANTTAEGMASLTDVAPTVLAWLGLPVPTDLDGVDLRPRRQSPRRPPSNRILYAEGVYNAPPAWAVREGPIKLHYSLRDKKGRLFDLASDPGEQVDLSAKRPETYQRLFDAWQAFAKAEREGDPLPKPPKKDLKRLEQLGYLDD
ncbi:MAG: sulfatase [Phycisphaerae bacterium]